MLTLKGKPYLRRPEKHLFYKSPKNREKVKYPHSRGVLLENTIYYAGEFASGVVEANFQNNYAGIVISSVFTQTWHLERKSTL